MLLFILSKRIHIYILYITVIWQTITSIARIYEQKRIESMTGTLNVTNVTLCHQAFLLKKVADQIGANFAQIRVRARTLVATQWQSSRDRPYFLDVQGSPIHVAC